MIKTNYNYEVDSIAKAYIVSACVRNFWEMASWQNGALAWVTCGVHVDIKVPEHYLNPLKKGLVVHFFVHAWKFDDAILIKLNQNCFEITWGVHMCILKVPESFKYTKFDTEKLKFGLEWLGKSKTRLRVLKKAKNGKNVSFFWLPLERLKGQKLTFGEALKVKLKIWMASKAKNSRACFDFLFTRTA